MAAREPVGEPVGERGPLPAGSGPRGDWGVYLHVPFCAHRCGYCDFNTYTPAELAGSADPAGFLAAARAELAWLARTLPERPPAATVFVGGGTPTVLPPGALAGLLAELGRTLGVAPGAEVTVEANPETVTAALLEELLGAGVTRLSLGMQSAVTGVLAVLERRHTPGRAAEAVALARRAGLQQVSLDLIYGTPGESEADWHASLQAALAAGPSHVSAYGLVVEEGTALARRIAAGALPAPDDDVLAERYVLAEQLLGAAGLAWYEISNWGQPCRHNLGYWRGGDWLGVGPGAHSHVGGTRWWNLRHPRAYARALAEGGHPAAGRERLTPRQRELERVMLGIRLAEGLALADVPAAGRPEVAGVVSEGLAELAAAPGGPRLVLTLAGRLLADTVTRRLTG